MIGKSIILISIILSSSSFILIINGETCKDDTTCSENQTCCPYESSLTFGCCPFANAQCCSDDIHCCPENYVCNTAEGRCDKKSNNNTTISSIPIVKKNSFSDDIKAKTVCPGATATCTADQTCCQLKSGDWGCCPIPNADCCKDDEHCCPSGYTCDLKNNRCNKDNVNYTPLYRKQPATPIELNPCPGGKAGCPDESTCCQLSNGDYACCPIKNAVCCSDHIHCCPSGFTCDTKDNRCLRGNQSVAFNVKFESTTIQTPLKEEPAKNRETSVVCPDGESFCPDDYTCCLNNDQSYGCCPMPKASCCSDHLHCCPENTKCNLEAGACEHPNNELGHYLTTWKEKKTAFKKTDQALKLDPVVCADNSTCDPLKTCCLMSDDVYGCCPYSDAICCDDYCCPSDFECGHGLGECVALEPTSAKNVLTNWHRIEEKAKKINSDCSDCISSNSTCCGKSDGSYACCPYAKGECCGNDGLCCPNDYTCQSDGLTCVLDPNNRSKNINNNNNNIIPIDDHKIVAIKLSQAVSKTNHFLQLFYDDSSSIQAVACVDGVHYCPLKTTCCEKSFDFNANNIEGTKSFGCCGVENAVCCDDGINCCPQGYECANNGSASCREL